MQNLDNSSKDCPRNVHIPGTVQVEGTMQTSHPQWKYEDGVPLRFTVWLFHAQLQSRTNLYHKETTKHQTTRSEPEKRQTIHKKTLRTTASCSTAVMESRTQWNNLKELRVNPGTKKLFWKVRYLLRLRAKYIFS